jgi:hypothetical protein
VETALLLVRALIVDAHGLKPGLCFLGPSGRVPRLPEACLEPIIKSHEYFNGLLGRSPGNRIKMTFSAEKRVSIRLQYVGLRAHQLAREEQMKSLCKGHRSAIIPLVPHFQR